MKMDEKIFEKSDEKEAKTGEKAPNFIPKLASNVVIEPKSFESVVPSAFKALRKLQPQEQSDILQMLLSVGAWVGAETSATGGKQVINSFMGMADVILTARTNKTAMEIAEDYGKRIGPLIDQMNVTDAKTQA